MGTEQLATHGRDLPISASFPLLFDLPASTISQPSHKSTKLSENRESKPRFKSALQSITEPEQAVGTDRAATSQRLGAEHKVQDAVHLLTTTYSIT